VRDYRPLLIRRLDARLPGLRILRLRLNRHLPEADALDDHTHAFTQTLCYLAGRGTLRLEGHEHAVVAGAVAIIPAGTVHGFVEGRGHRPLSLAIDLEHRPAPAPRFATLNASEATRIRSALSELSRVRNPSGDDARLLASAMTLQILDIEFRALGLLSRPPNPLPGFVRKFNHLATQSIETPIATLASHTGYQPDYLNRKFKETTGLTLRQHRDTIRLQRAKRALAMGIPVHQAASEAGFDDPNYFSRWFKRQTGSSPRNYQNS
jgi:AraC family transcriptional regulator, transcriptional activator of pobA